MTEYAYQHDVFKQAIFHNNIATYWLKFIAILESYAIFTIFFRELSFIIDRKPVGVGDIDIETKIDDACVLIIGNI